MFYKPQQPLLSRLVICYWFINANDIPKGTKMLPDGYSDIMLNFGDPYFILRPSGITEKIRDHSIFGQRSTHLLLNQPGNVNMIGIRLKPGSEFAFSGMHGQQLFNANCPLHEIADKEILTVDFMIKKTELSLEEKVSLIDKLLCEMLRKTGAETNEKTDLAVDLILKRKGNITLEELLDEVNCTYKQAERFFQKYIGLSPKLFIRIHRFYNAFVQVRNLRKADWIEVLTNFGYYDQSHFIKDFRFFSGVSPGKQLSENNTLDSLFGFR